MDQIIKARFLRDGKPSGKEYTYFSKNRVEVGMIVEPEKTTVISNTPSKPELIVTQVDVPESEIEAFKDKMKYIIEKKQEADPDDGEISKA